MVIGFDLTPLQGGHRQRGIGAALANIVAHVPQDARDRHRFVFYLDREARHGVPEVLAGLDLAGFDFEVRDAGIPKRPSFGRLPHGMARVLELALSGCRLDPRCDLAGVDVYVEVDQCQRLPRRAAARTALMIHDLIPLVLEEGYLSTYRGALREGLPVSRAISSHWQRLLYKRNLALNTRRATWLLADSEYTARTFAAELGVSRDRVTVVPLGVSVARPRGEAAADAPAAVADAPFFFFLGGADRRRRIADLVAAFDAVRTSGRHARLCLAGDTLTGPGALAAADARRAVESSRFGDDIVFLGYVADDVRDWLYGHAAAFVFPSVCEGFGLPVLEAMAQGCPVICYRNDATLEVAGDVPVYASGVTDLERAMLAALDATAGERETVAARGRERAARYSWDATAEHIVRIVTGREPDRDELTTPQGAET